MAGRPGEAPGIRMRAARGTLSRDRIVDAALEITDRRGIGALTMPALAAHVGAGTMSLYRHVRNKADLLEAVAGRVFGGLEVTPAAPGDWKGCAAGYLREWRRRALQHPGLGPLLPTLGAGPPPGHLEACAAVFAGAGFEAEEAGEAFLTAFAYTLGFVLRETSPSGTGRSDDRFERGLALVLDGLGSAR